MRHPDCLGQRRVSTRHRDGVHKCVFSKQQWLYGDCPISQVFLVFLRHTADANLGARVDEVGFTIVHKSTSVLNVFQTRGFRTTVWYGDCFDLYRERVDE